MSGWRQSGMDVMGWEFAAVCKDCLLFSSSTFFLVYGLLVFATSLARFDLVLQPQSRVPAFDLAFRD